MGLPGGSGGPDFLENDPYPYAFNFGIRSLVEIPITILPTKFPLNKSSKIARSFFRNVDNNLFLRAFRKLLYNNQPLWLRPLPWMDAKQFLQLIIQSIKISLPYIVMMFHSSELMPGCSMYRKSEDDVEKLYELLEVFFVILCDYEINSVTLTEAARCYKQ
jgi:hypothetical protein